MSLNLNGSVLPISLFSGQQASLWGQRAACAPPGAKRRCENFAHSQTRKDPAGLRGSLQLLPWVLSCRRASVRGAILGERSKGVDHEPKVRGLAGDGDERQISVLAVWTEEKGARGNLGEGASWKEGSQNDGQFWGGGSLLTLQSPQTCLRSVGRKAEVGGGRRKKSGREKRREERKGGGDNGQKIDMSSDHSPFLCLSAWWAELATRALRRPGAGREPASQPASPALGIGPRPRTPCWDCLG